MAKLTLNNLTSGFASTATLNANFDAIEAALENTLSRDGTTPNQMQADLDMNSNGILNLASLDVASLMVNGVPVTTPELSVSEVPAQATHTGKFLQTNGTVASWQVPDADDITFDNGSTGSEIRELGDKLRDFVSVKDFGAVGDGVTDDTVMVQAAIDSFTGSGFVLINRGVLYDFSLLTIPQNITLWDEANNRIVFHDAALEDGHASNLLIRSPIEGPTRVHIEPNGNVTGTAAKLDLMFDPYQDDGTNYRIINAYTKTYDASDASTTQGNNGVAVLGVKGVGRNFGIWPTLHFGFSDDGALSAVPMKMYYFDTSDTMWRTPMKGMWMPSTAVTVGEYRLSANKMYQADGSGTTGLTAPSHAAGSSSDGGVNWTFIRDFAAVSGSIKGCIVIGDRDDLPKFGLPTVRAQVAQDVAVWNGKKIRFLDGSNASVWSVFSNGSTDDLYIETEDGAKRLRLDATGQFLQITGLSVASTASTATDLDTTPSIKGVRTLVFNNSGSTSVTQFDDGIGYQEFFVRSGNGQTTLVHGANLVLIGGVNKTLSATDALFFQMNGAGTVATQI